MVTEVHPTAMTRDVICNISMSACLSDIYFGAFGLFSEVGKLSWVSSNEYDLNKAVEGGGMIPDG